MRVAEIDAPPALEKACVVGEVLQALEAFLAALEPAVAEFRGDQLRQPGRIAVDGKASRGYTRSSLRRAFGMVLQDTWLFEGTVVGSESPLQVAVARLLGYRWPDQEPDALDALAKLGA